LPEIPQKEKGFPQDEKDGQVMLSFILHSQLPAQTKNVASFGEKWSQNVEYFT
jgi:hypothetical protein